MRKLVFRFSDHCSDTKWVVQLKKEARSLKFQFYKEEGWYYPCSKNRGSYCTANLCLCFHIYKQMSCFIVTGLIEKRRKMHFEIHLM